MKWISPYMEDGNWYKGNLHTHTHVSDGGFSVDYAVVGYQHMAKHDFVVLTDHNYLKKMNPDKAIFCTSHTWSRGKDDLWCRFYRKGRERLYLRGLSISDRSYP